MSERVDMLVLLRLRDEQRRIWEHPDTDPPVRLRARRLMLLLEELADYRLEKQESGAVIEGRAALPCAS